MDCPTCGKSLTTEQGMRQHHTKVHGDPLPNRTCSGCGVNFYDPEARRKYCNDCDPNAGEHNGNWQAAKERTECERCGTKFEYYPSDKKGVYCSDCVEEADEFLGEHYAEVHDIEPVSRICDECDQEFTILPCHVRNDRARFCSVDCFHTWLPDRHSDGTAVYNGDWFQVKRQALERDDHRCQYCGKTRTEIGREPDVHHIEPIRGFDDPQDAHSLDNVVCLCRSCHRYAEFGTIPRSEIEPGTR